jgi:sigma-B regulation protein RsbU (phosphoserine phosphatase)
VLTLVNAHLFGNTTASAYATLFFGRYRSDGRLRYVNCGHPPALLVRADSRVEQLPSTSTVLGLFDAWECRMEATTIRPGDTLILYTDGVTECLDAAGREFGLDRLAGIVTRMPAATPAQAVLDAIVQELSTFTGGETGDDVTLIVAKRQAVGQRHRR